jgi:hypothetical protein
VVRVTGRVQGARVAVAPAFSALIGAALLLLTMIAGVGGAGALSAIGTASATPVLAVGAVSTNAAQTTGDRRATTLPGVGSRQQHPGWAPDRVDAGEPVATGWQQPSGLVDLAVEAGPSIIALTIQVSHRGRAPPAGSLLS